MVTDERRDLWARLDHYQTELQYPVALLKLALELSHANNQQRNLKEIGYFSSCTANGAVLLSYCCPKILTLNVHYLNNACIDACYTMELGYLPEIGGVSGLDATRLL
jgi:hypothetical protein